MFDANTYEFIVLAAGKMPYTTSVAPHQPAHSLPCSLMRPRILALIYNRHLSFSPNCANAQAALELPLPNKAHDQCPNDTAH